MRRGAGRAQRAACARALESSARLSFPSPSLSNFLTNFSASCFDIGAPPPGRIRTPAISSADSPPSPFVSNFLSASSSVAAFSSIAVGCAVKGES